MDLPEITACKSWPQKSTAVLGRLTTLGHFTTTGLYCSRGCLDLQLTLMAWPLVNKEQLVFLTGLVGFEG